MKGLASSDTKSQSIALDAADKFLYENQSIGGKPSVADKNTSSEVKTGFDKTIINKVMILLEGFFWSLIAGTCQVYVFSVSVVF